MSFSINRFSIYEWLKMRIEILILLKLIIQMNQSTPFVCLKFFFVSNNPNGLMEMNVPFFFFSGKKNKIENGQVQIRQIQLLIT